jgi:hypothetical protein
MIATLIVTFGVFALAMLGLSIGVIFGKKTPLKGSCGAPLKHKPGQEYECNSCNCHDDKKPTVRPVQIT